MGRLTQIGIRFHDISDTRSLSEIIAFYKKYHPGYCVDWNEEYLKKNWDAFFYVSDVHDQRINEFVIWLEKEFCTYGKCQVLPMISGFMFRELVVFIKGTESKEALIKMILRWS